MSKSKLVVAGLVAVLIGSYFVFDLGQYLSLDYLKQSRDAFEVVFRDHPVTVIAIFFIGYVTVTGLSLPGAAIMTLAAGALFGLVTGTLIVSFASSIGATVAFLASRFLFRDTVQRKFRRRLTTVNEGIERDGAFYLFSLRLVPVIPFFVINLAMGLTPLRTWTFYWVSQLGMLAGTIVYVNAGTQLAQLDTVSGLLSWNIVGAFLLLAAFPWLARAALQALRARRAHRGWIKPAHFDRNLVVIGAGSAGLVSAYIAATVRAKVTLVERDKMGGDCLNTGCVPSKALIKSANVMHQTRHLADYGIEPVSTRVDFAAVMERIQRIIAKVEPHDSIERYTRLGVDCRIGSARLVSPWDVEITKQNGQVERLTTRAIVIATGARPLVPPIPGIEDIDYLTSETLWQIREQPRRLLVLGGGPIGCELAQSFARLGSDVTQVEMNARLLSRDEPEAAELVHASLAADGVAVMLHTRAERFARENGEQVVYATQNGHEIRIPFDKALIALGRRANTEDLDLERLGIPLRDNGTIESNEHLQTAMPNVYVCGDVAGPFQFTHTASHQAWYAAVNALFGRFKQFKADYTVIPWTTFTDPEVAHVGITEAEAQAQDIDYEVTRYGIDDLDRAIADGVDRGMIKVITPKGSDRVLGATIAGTQAGDLLTEFVTAMKHGLGLKKIQGTIHVYPTLAEANKFASGEWQKAHAPERALQWVGRLNDWLRGSRAAPATTKAPSVQK